MCVCWCGMCVCVWVWGVGVGDVVQIAVVGKREYDPV